MTIPHVHPPPPVHGLLMTSTQNIPEQHVAPVVQAAPMPEQVVGGAWQLVAPPSGLSHVNPVQHDGPEVCEHAVPLERHVPASGWGGAQR